MLGYFKEQLTAAEGKTMDLEKATNITSGEVDTWWEGDIETQKSIPVAEFDALCAELGKQNDIVKELKARLKDETGILEKMKTKIMAYLEEFGKTKYPTDYGTIFLTNKFSVKTPKTEEAKRSLFMWLKQKGISMQYLTVNSVSLNALYKSELDAQGEDFKMPGVDEPTFYQTLTIRGK